MAPAGCLENALQNSLKKRSNSLLCSAVCTEGGRLFRSRSWNTLAINLIVLNVCKAARNKCHRTVWTITTVQWYVSVDDVACGKRRWGKPRYGLMGRWPCVCVCVCVYIYICVCVCVCTCVAYVTCSRSRTLFYQWHVRTKRLNTPLNCASRSHDHDKCWCMEGRPLH